MTSPIERCIQSSLVFYLLLIFSVHVSSKGFHTMENASIVLKVVLRVIPAFLIGALWWLIPYWGFLAYGYANVMPVVGLSIVWLFSMVFVLSTIMEELPEEIGVPFFIGIVVNFVFWVSLIFTNTYANSNDVLIREVDGRAQVVEVTSERVYPFWNNDFQRIAQTSYYTSYEMDARCETGLCRVKARIDYDVSPAFALAHAADTRNYEPILNGALTVAVVRDGAQTIPAVEAAVCSNFKARYGMAESEPCPLTLKVALTVEQRQ